MLPPLLRYFFGETFALTLVKNFYAPVCHQNPSRSFALLGTPCAVCIRCASVYFSFLCGVVLWNFVQRNAELVQYCSAIFSFPRVFIFLVPLLADVGARVLGFYDDGFSLYTTRIISGALFGCTFAFALLPIFFSACDELMTQKKLQENVYDVQTK